MEENENTKKKKKWGEETQNGRRKGEERIMVLGVNGVWNGVWRVEEVEKRWTRRREGREAGKIKRYKSG